jgi:hypothetical protein
VPVGLAQELSDGLCREVADGDDAVVAGGSAEGGSVGPVGAAPDGDAGLLERTGEEADAVDVKMAAGVVDRLPRPQLRDDVQSLVEDLGAGDQMGTTARSTRAVGSPNGPKGGRKIPCFTRAGRVSGASRARAP